MSLRTTFILTFIVRLLEGGLKIVYELMSLYSPFCPAPSTDGADGKKRADCLSPPQGG
jgi:hypothetical protein